MNYNKSEQFFEEAKKYIPGGVNSPVRAFNSVGGTPLFIERGEGCKIYDADGNEFIEYIGSWGPHLFGHNPDFILNALKSSLENGTSFGAPTELEIKMAKLITELVPSVEKIRMVNSGTEATMSAIRAARGFTNKNKFIKFEGCYHGHADYFLIKAGSGALTFGVPTSPGVTKANAADTLVANYNDIDSVKSLINENKNEIAAIIIEPIAGNMGVVPAKKEFLSELRTLCTEEEIILIFDEVMSGFRVAKGGASEIYNINPDLTTFGKIIGGGLPVGAFGGRADIMNTLAPVGPVYQAGTLSGNPLAMSAGIAALTHIKENENLYNLLEEKAKYLEDGLKENMKRFNKSFAITRVGSMSCLFFTENPVDNFSSALKADTTLYGKYFHKMLENGIYLAPSQFEAMFISTAHSTNDLDKTIEANYNSLKELL
jgi:glutamate-1-semialdehyde 2,1-aminomutase